MKALRLWVLGALVAVFACGRPEAPVVVDAGAPALAGWTDAGGEAGQSPAAASVETRVAPPPAKPDPRTPAQLAAAACSGPGGEWRCTKVARPTVRALGTTPITPAGWTVPNWFVDPANASGNASDGNACTTSGAPCLTLGELTYHRYGTQTPVLPQATTVTLLSNDTAADPWVIIPSFSGGSLTLQGSPTVSLTTTIGVFTAAVRGGANTLATITSPGVPSWAGKSGQLIHDTTVGATFYVSADLGGGVASLTNQVHFPVGFNPAPVTIANGDTIQLLTLPTVFVQNLTYQSYGPSSGLIAQQLNINASSVAFFEYMNVYECTMAAPFNEASAPNTFADCFFKNALSGPATYQAGQVAAFTSGAIGYTTSFDGDVILAGGINAFGTIRLNAVYMGGAFTNETSTTLLQVISSATYGPSGRAIVWGPNAVNAANGAQLSMANATGTAAQVFVNTGGLQLDGAATGLTFNTGTGTFSAGPSALSPANLDTNRSYQNPQTGSRMHF